MKQFANLLFLLALISVTPVFAGNTCKELISNSQEDLAKKTFETLPAKTTARYKAMLEDVRHQLEKSSYAIVDLREFISPETGHEWYTSLPHDVPSQIAGRDILFTRNQELNKQPASSWQMQGIANLSSWVKGVIEEASPKTFPMNHGFVGVRNSTSTGEGMVFDEWHVDGGYASATLAVHGIGTEILGPVPNEVPYGSYHAIRGERWEPYLTQFKPLILPTGYLVIFFGDRAGIDGIFQPTVHRTPLITGERTLFVLRY